MNWLQSFFSTPARQALGWTTLGILGIAMAAGGIWFLTGDSGGPGQVVQADDSTPEATNTATATPTRTPTPSPSPSPSPTPTETPSPSPTTRPAVSNPGTGGGAPAAGGPSEPDPTATPTPEPVVAGGDYCPPANIQGTLPSGRVAGALTVAGVPATAGSLDVYLAFDGVIGPGAKNIDGAFRVDFWAGGSGCANQVGSAISVVVNGQTFGTGRIVGDGAGPLIAVTVALP